jgi:hypothetical protein
MREVEATTRRIKEYFESTRLHYLLIRRQESLHLLAVVLLYSCVYSDIRCSQLERGVFGSTGRVRHLRLFKFH